jgi:NitT/TauT family transport system ATP-binding protein
VRLICNHLTVTFPTPAGPVPALRDVSLEVREGEFVSVVGPSGCGKTTLLRSLAGMIAPDEGSIERFSSRREGDGRMPLVFQEHSLFPWMTVLENAAFGLRMAGCAKREREERALALLARFGFTGREGAYPHELSLGMKQRVAVIRCFLSDPEIMLMDEPFAGLDYQTRLNLQRELLELWEQDHKSVVFVTHDIEEAILLSDRILVLDRQPGTVVAEFSVPFARPRRAELTLEQEFLVLKRSIWGGLAQSLGGPERALEARVP